MGLDDVLREKAEQQAAGAKDHQDGMKRAAAARDVFYDRVVADIVAAIRTDPSMGEPEIMKVMGLPQTRVVQVECNAKLRIIFTAVVGATAVGLANVTAVSIIVANGTTRQEGEYVPKRSGTAFGTGVIPSSLYQISPPDMLQVVYTLARAL